MRPWMAVGVCLTLAASAALAQEPAPPAETKGPAAAKAAPPRPGPVDPQAAAEAWARMATPGEPHRWLSRWAGTWDARTTMWPEPGRPVESTGTMVNALVLEGRFVEERLEGTFMDQPFHGLGYAGYDNSKRKFVSTWMDTTTTSVMVTEGTLDALGKVLISFATMDDPVTGKPVKVKTVLKVLDDDHHLFEMWGTTPEGKPRKEMEIQYTRRK
jgi:hypothetical protein